MALAVARGSEISKQHYFDAIKRFCREKVVGFEYFRLLAAFDGEPLELARPFQFLDEDKTKALAAYFELLTTLNIHNPTAKIDRTVPCEKPEILVSSIVRTDLGELRLWLIHPNGHALRY